jgi:hypothetical protein
MTEAPSISMSSIRARRRARRQASHASVRGRFTVVPRSTLLSGARESRVSATNLLGQVLVLLGQGRVRLDPEEPPFTDGLRLKEKMRYGRAGATAFILAIFLWASGAGANSESPSVAAPRTIVDMSAPSTALVRASAASRILARAKIGSGTSMPILLTYAQAKAAGYPVPELDPDLPICPPGLGPGFSTSVVDDGAVDPNGPTICQLDIREATIRIGGP